MRKRIISLVLSAVIFTSLISVRVKADPTSDINNQQQKINEQNSMLNSAKGKTQSYEAQAIDLDTEINKQNIEINNTTKKINAVKVDIVNTQKDIDKAEQEVKDEQDLFNKRMRAIYENGGEGYLSVILSSKSFSDMISKVEVVSKISDLDKKVMKELDDKKTAVKNKQKTLDKQNGELNKYLADQKTKLNDLNTKKQQLSVIVAQAKKEEAMYASQVAAELKKLEQLKAAAAAAQKSPSRGGNYGTATGQKIVLFAMKFLGTKYVWGGTTPAGFDCSGFTQYVYANFGISISRTSEQQVFNGSPVNGDLQMGDLVFFRNSLGDVHHVGIYVGDGMFIHSPHTGDVIKISPLSYMPDYYCARRILK